RTDPVVSVVVATWNRPDSLAACLRALDRQTLARGRYEVIVCDDGSTTPVAQQLATSLAELGKRLTVRVIRQENAGPAAARNLGAGLARGRYLAFTDDDCEPTPDWLNRLLARFDESPDVLIGGGIRNGLPSDVHAAATHAIMDYVYADRERRDRPRLFSTSNLSLPRDGFQAIGGFSGVFPDAAGEDYDLCWRWHESGRGAAYAPEAAIVHRHGLTFGMFVRQHFSYGRGLLRMRRQRSARTGARTGSLAFILRLMFHPLRRWRDPAMWRTTLLIAISQLATVAGAAVEWVRPSSPLEKRELASAPEIV
ncbi:MAG: glycosyltransferase, partial [Gemmatimonadetes bacterium]|nr:glycosyltransferase [Gemmatimonadota bacterium]